MMNEIILTFSNRVINILVLYKCYTGVHVHGPRTITSNDEAGLQISLTNASGGLKNILEIFSSYYVHKLDARMVIVFGVLF